MERRRGRGEAGRGGRLRGGAGIRRRVEGGKGEEREKEETIEGGEPDCYGTRERIFGPSPMGHRPQ